MAPAQHQSRAALSWCRERGWLQKKGECCGKGDLCTSLKVNGSPSPFPTALPPAPAWDEPPTASAMRSGTARADGCHPRSHPRGMLRHAAAGLYCHGTCSH